MEFLGSIDRKPRRLWVNRTRSTGFCVRIIINCKADGSWAKRVRFNIERRAQVETKQQQKNNNNNKKNGCYSEITICKWHVEQIPRAGRKFLLLTVRMYMCMYSKLKKPNDSFLGGLGFSDSPRGLFRWWWRARAMTRTDDLRFFHLRSIKQQPAGHASGR